MQYILIFGDKKCLLYYFRSFCTEKYFWGQKNISWKTWNMSRQLFLKQSFWGYQTILGKYVPAPGRECLYKKELGRFEGYSLGKCAYECSGNPYCVSFQWRSAPIFAQTELEKKLTSRCDLSASCMGEFTIRSSPGNNLYFKNGNVSCVFEKDFCVNNM